LELQEWNYMVISRKISFGGIALIIVVFAIAIATGWFQFIVTPHVNIDTAYGNFIVPTALLKGPENLSLTTGRTLPVISAHEELHKLQVGEAMPQGGALMCNCDPISYLASNCACVLSVTSITLSYNHEGLYDPHQSLNPVWVFDGTFSDGFHWHYEVYAWKFANFTGISGAGSSPLTVQFNDTSQDFPNQWLWDFGDGSNSTLQNVTHRYVSPGMYNITLNAGNPRGNDSITKEILVGNIPGGLLNPNSTIPAGSAETGNTP